MSAYLSFSSYSANFWRGFCYLKDFTLTCLQCGLPVAEDELVQAVSGEIWFVKMTVLLIWWYRLVTPKGSQWLVTILNSGELIYQKTNADYFPKLSVFEITYLNLEDLLAGFHSKNKSFFSLFICIWDSGPHQLTAFCHFPFDYVEDSGRNASQNGLLKESEQLISALLGSWFSAFLLVWLWGKPLLNFLCDTLAALKLSKTHQICLKLMS